MPIPYQEAPTVAPDSRPPDDYLHVSASPEQFGGLIGRGLQQAGQGVENAANNAFDLDRFWGQIQTDGALNNAQRDTQAAVEEFKKLRGGDALRAQDGVNKQLDDLTAQYRSQLKSPAQQLAYDNAMRTFRQRFLAGQVTTHAVQQGQSVALETGKETYKQSLMMIPSAPNEEDALHLISDMANASVKNVHVQFGEGSPEIEKGAATEAWATGLKAYIESVRANDPADARRLTEKYKNQLGLDYAPLMEQLRAGAEQETGRQAAAKYAAAAMQGGIGNVATLPPGTKAFFQARSNARVDGMNPAFADHLMQAATAFEDQNPGKVARFESLRRTREEQAAAYQRYQAGEIGLAARPGLSRHEYGLAADIPDGAFLNWLHANGDRYGLSFLPGHAGRVDPGHVQLAGPSPITGNSAQPSPQFGAQTVTFTPAHEEMPAEPYGDQPTMGEQLANAMRGVLSDPGLNEREREIAQRALEQQFRMLEITENQTTKARKEQADRAASSVVEGMENLLHSPNPDWVAFSGQVTRDPNLTWEMKERFLEKVRHLSGEEQQLAYGSGYMAAREGLFSAPEAAGHINDFSSLVMRPDITLAGLKDLKERMNLVRNNPDRHSIEQRVNSFIRGAKQDLSFEDIDGPIKIRDPKGEHIFNYRFVPEFIKRVDDLAQDADKTGNRDKLDKFLEPANVEKFVRSFRNKQQMDMERVAATGEAMPEKPGALREPVPAPPQGIDAAAWVPLMHQRPVNESGAPLPMATWAKVVAMLKDNPSEEIKQAFDSHFGNTITADQVLGRFAKVPGASAMPTASTAEQPSAGAPATPAPTYAAKFKEAEQSTAAEEQRRSDEAETVATAQALKEQRAETEKRFAERDRETSQRNRQQTLADLDREEFAVEKSGLAGNFKASRLKSIRDRREKLKAQIAADHQ